MLWKHLIDKTFNHNVHNSRNMFRISMMDSRDPDSAQVNELCVVGRVRINWELMRVQFD